MAGSIPIVTYLFKNNSTNTEMLKECIKQLTEEGWEWYVDFYVDWAALPLEFQVFNPKLSDPVRYLLFEKAF